MEDKELCCICLDYTIDFDIADFDIIDFGIEDFGIEDVSKGNSGNYKVLNCCNNTIHKYCFMVLFLYGYEDCPLCRCNICINDYFTLDDFHDFYLYSNTINTSNTSKILNKLLWKLCNYNYYYYFRTTFNTYVVRRKYNVCNVCNVYVLYILYGLYDLYDLYKKISSYLLCKVICIMIIIACFYFLSFYICTLLYQS